MSTFCARSPCYVLCARAIARALDDAKNYARAGRMRNANHWNNLKSLPKKKLFLQAHHLPKNGDNKRAGEVKRNKKEIQKI